MRLCPTFSEAMNDPKPPRTGLVKEIEEPPSLFQKLKARIRAPWRSRQDVDALREAALELIEEAADGHVPPAAEREFLSNVISLREKEVADCMVPRADIVAIEIDSPMKELLALMIQHGHSRIPVYRETLDETIGMIHIKDIMPCLVEGEESPLRDLLRPLLFVAPSMPVAKLLLQMRQTRQHMAMVIDEFGGVDGLVTIEDLVEEIVGEIRDEHDEPAAPELIARSDGSLIVDARMDIEAFEARLGPMLTQEERETIDTLAGYVFHLAGHVPKIGETVPGPGEVLFDILETDQNRIGRVRVRKGGSASKK